MRVMSQGDACRQFDCGYYNGICVSYALAAVERAGADAELLRRTRRELCSLLDLYTAEEITSGAWREG